MNEKALESISRANAKRFRRPKQKTLAELEAECLKWNVRHPIGTRVIYHPVIGEVAGIETQTRTGAYVLSGHTAVLFVDAKAGCVALDARGADHARAEGHRMIPPRSSDAGPERRNYRLVRLRGDLERLPEATGEPSLLSDDQTEAQVPDEPLCPVLEALIVKAQNVAEVCQLFDQHETECVLCKPGLRRAA